MVSDLPGRRACVRGTCPFPLPISGVGFVCSVCLWPNSLSPQQLISPSKLAMDHGVRVAELSDPGILEDASTSPLDCPAVEPSLCFVLSPWNRAGSQRDLDTLLECLSARLSVYQIGGIRIKQFIHSLSNYPARHTVAACGITFPSFRLFPFDTFFSFVSAFNYPRFPPFVWVPALPQIVLGFSTASFS